MLPIWVIGALLLVYWLWIVPAMLHVTWWLQHGKPGTDDAPTILAADNRLFGVEFAPYTQSGISYETIREIVAIWHLYELTQTA